LACVSDPAACLWLRVKLQVLSVLVVIGGVNDRGILAHKSAAVVKIFEAIC
jgi:hypothetical protein